MWIEIHLSASCTVVVGKSSKINIMRITVIVVPESALQADISPKVRVLIRTDISCRSGGIF